MQQKIGSKSKLDVLSKYISTKTNTQQKSQRFNSHIIDESQQWEKKIQQQLSSEDDENPLFVETESSLAIKKDVKANFLKKIKDSDNISSTKTNKTTKSGKWTKIKEDHSLNNNDSSGSSSDSSYSSDISSRRGRLDSDSDDSELEGANNKKKILTAAEKDQAFVQTMSKALGTQNQPETVYRDAQGQKMNLQDILKGRRDELQRKNEERVREWGQGAAQRKEKAQKDESNQEIKQEGFTAYDIPKEIENKMAQKERFGDPMVKLILEETERRKKNQGLASLMGKCKFPAPPNRFGIVPGKNWDGVDRSSGYEKKFLDLQNLQIADKEEKYIDYSKDL